MTPLELIFILGVLVVIGLLSGIFWLVFKGFLFLFQIGWFIIKGILSVLFWIVSKALGD